MSEQCHTFIDGDELSVDQDTIAAGETTTVTLSIPSDVWVDERLAPIGETRPLVTGVVRLEDGEGHENFATASTFLAFS